MNLHFYVMQYADSPRAKGRNIAVLAFDGWRAYYRALGVTGNQFKPEYFQSLSKKARDNEWVYREWLHWFDSLCKIVDAAQFDEAMARLKTNPFGLTVSGEGVIGLTEGRADIPAAMDNLFGQFVRIPRVSPVIAFENRVAELFQRSEIAYLADFFNEPAEVELVSDESGDVVTLEFSHLLAGENPVGFSTLILQGAKQAALSVQAERIAENFNRAVLTGFLRRDRCILLCGKLQKKHREMMGPFSGVATVLDVFDESAPDTIRRLVGFNT